jgi:hypothetical protein
MMEQASLQIQLERAGMMPETSIRSDRALIPSTPRIESGFLVYDPTKCECKKIDPTKVLLKLIEVNCEEEIVRFAGKYGVLYLDDRGLPVDDRLVHGAMIGERSYGPAGRESVAEWLYFARACRAMLAISAKIHAGRCGSPDEWKAIIPNYTGTGKRGSVELEKSNICVVLWEWSLKSNLRPTLHWDGPPTIRLTFRPFGSGLFDIVLLTLMMRICRTDGLAICGSCQRFFPPDSRARRGDVRFCPECRRNGSANRVSAQLYRARIREEKSGKGA